VKRRAGDADQRVRQAIVMPKGKAMTSAVDKARDRLGRTIFAKWNERDIAELVRLTPRFADAVNGKSPDNQANVP
jgi:DNA-binding MarR family transcriptional regulator